MKSFKTLLFLTATLSASLLTACGVDSPESDQQAQGAQLEQSNPAQQVSESAVGKACLGTVQCVVGPSSTAVVNVDCRWSSSSVAACAAPCPSGTTYKSGSCSIVIVDPPPSTTP